MRQTRISLGLAAGLLVATLAMPLTVHAISDAEACAQEGGVYENDRGTKSCTITETPGKNQGGVTKAEETSQKGSFSSSHPQTEEECVENRGGSHCK